MTWARLDDKFHDHPKVLATSPASLGIYALALSYCADQLTDGFVAEPVVRTWHGWKRSAEELVRNGLWHTATGGFQIHDYLDWNPSRVQVLQERQAATERQQRARMSRRTNGRTPAGVRA